MEPIFYDTSIYFIPDNLVKVDLGWTENHAENALTYWLQEWTVKAIISPLFANDMAVCFEYSSTFEVYQPYNGCSFVCL